MFLKCNNIKCRSEIQRMCMVTQCFHLFCHQCYPKIIKTKICIACKSYCEEQDSVIKELQIVPCLLGHSPQQIFEQVHRGISFWMYQIDQEIIIQNALREKSEENSLCGMNDLKQMKTNFKLQVESLEQKIKRLECALEKEKEMVFDLNNLLADKTKQCQKLLNVSDRNKMGILKPKNVNCRHIDSENSSE